MENFMYSKLSLIQTPKILEHQLFLQLNQEKYFNECVNDHISDLIEHN